jgi:murein DD-endopeptidase MepM/ murein hydrolase activator NlpD
MDIWKKNLNHRNFTPIKICLTAIVVMAVVSSWQQVRMSVKDRTIAKLMRENAALKNDLFSIDDQLVELKDTASDTRIFQKELIKVIKEIDQNYPINFGAHANHANSGSGGLVAQNPQIALKNAGENILKLSSSQQNLRFQTASLLGRAVSIREILSKTPSMMPVGTGYVSSDFGVRHDPFTKEYKKHHGIDIAAPLGTPVVASADGRVKIAMRNRSLGNVIELEHDDGFATAYGHLSEILVRKNEFVKRGQEIGRVGKTGTRCQGSHVHFEVKKHGVRQDPKPFLVSSPPRYL